MSRLGDIVPRVVVYLKFTFTKGALLIIPSLLVNCTISSLAKTPNQFCKLSLKRTEYIYDYHCNYNYLCVPEALSGTVFVTAHALFGLV